MPISEFQIRNDGPIKYAEAKDLPSVVIIAGPNGVGKSTLLDALGKRRGNVIKGTGKFLYLSPYRTPAAFSLHKSLPYIGPRTRFVDILASASFSFPIYGGPISLPYYLTSDGPRTPLTPDFAPYFNVKLNFDSGLLNRPDFSSPPFFIDTTVDTTFI